MQSIHSGMQGIYKQDESIRKLMGVHVKLMRHVVKGSNILYISAILLQGYIRVSIGISRIKEIKHHKGLHRVCIPQQQLRQVGHKPKMQSKHIGKDPIGHVEI